MLCIVKCGEVDLCVNGEFVFDVVMVWCCVLWMLMCVRCVLSVVMCVFVMCVMCLGC